MILTVVLYKLNFVFTHVFLVKQVVIFLLSVVIYNINLVR